MILPITLNSLFIIRYSKDIKPGFEQWGEQTNNIRACSMKNAFIKGQNKVPP